MTEKHKQDASGLYLDSVDGRVANAEDLALYDQGADLLKTMQAPRFLSANDPHERLYYVCFDGTGNDFEKDPQHATNVALLKKQLEEIHGNSDDRIAVGYAAGPGTQDNLIVKTLDGARGYTYEDRIVERYKYLQRQVDRWQQEDPEARVRVVVVGFSRGAEQAAGFTRLLDEVGILDPDDNKIRYENNHWVGNPTHPPLVAPGQTPQAVALIDPVGTGKPLQFDRRMPPSVVSGIQLTSRDEARDQFKSTQIIEPGLSADGRFAGIIVPGAHSDVGGSYHRDGLAIRSGNLTLNYLNGLTEVPQLKLQAERSNPEMYVIHRSQDHLAIYTTHHFDKNQERGVRHEAPTALCRPVEVCVPEPANPTLMASLPRYALQPQTPPREPPMEPARPIALSPDVTMRDLSPEADRDNALQQQWQQQRQQQQLQQLQREEQRHTSAIQAASEQKEAAQVTLGSGLRMSDPDHPAYDNYEQARRAVVEMYSHQRKDVDERIEPMAASVVAQAQRDGLAHINDVKPSPDGQQLIASNTREANAAHRETAQLPMAQAANQSVEDSSRQWATHQIAQAQERIQEHTQARANVQERMQEKTQEFARTQAATLERAPVTAYTQAAQPQVVAPAMTAAVEARMPQPASPIQAQEQPTTHTPERAPVQTFASAVESQIAAPTLSAGIDTRMSPQTPQVQPQPYIPTPEQAPSHTFAPALEPQVVAPAMTADSDMQVQIQLAAQQAQQLAQQMLLQQQHIAELERQLQDKRSQEERREAERRDDQYREARQPDAQQRHDDPLQKEATAARHDLDPRHPQHPDHGMYKDIRGKVVDLHEANGVERSEEQIERITARVASDAKAAGMNHIGYLSVSVDSQGRPDLNMMIGTFEHQPARLYSALAITNVQQAMHTPVEDSHREMAQAAQQNHERSLQQQQQREQANAQEQTPMMTR